MGTSELYAGGNPAMDYPIQGCVWRGVGGGGERQRKKYCRIRDKLRPDGPLARMQTSKRLLKSSEQSQFTSSLLCSLLCKFEDETSAFRESRPFRF